MDEHQVKRLMHAMQLSMRSMAQELDDLRWRVRKLEDQVELVTATRENGAH